MERNYVPVHCMWFSAPVLSCPLLSSPWLSLIRMAGETRTIQVTGLPVGGSENRLIDKLQIHFLRKKNGGGEITSVTVSKTMPGAAFITFEDSEGERVSFFFFFYKWYTIKFHFFVIDGLKTMETFNASGVSLLMTSYMLCVFQIMNFVPVTH